MSESQAEARSHTDADHDSEFAGGSRSETGTLPRTMGPGAREGLAAIASAGAAASVLWGVRALRLGRRARAIASLLVGAGLGTLAVRWGRSGEAADASHAAESDDGFTDVSIDAEEGRETSEVESSGVDRTVDPVDEGDTEGESGVEEAELAGTEAALDRATPASGADADAEEAPEDGDADRAHAPPEAHSYERLGAAAFDEHADEVPLPQAVFDRQLLALGSEVFWGIRESDGNVIVAGQFDPLQDREGVRYVASSVVDDERTLAVPDVVLDHWDEVAGGGTVVTSGTDLVFVTSVELSANDWVLVVPEHRVEDLPGDLE